MKKNYRFSLMIALFAMFTISLSAQRIVEIDGYEPGVSTGTLDDFNNVLMDAIDADSTARKANPNTIYELKRNHLYPMGGIIYNYGYHLHIRGQEGDGLLPEITSGKDASGSYVGAYIRTKDDFTMENVLVNNFKPDGSYANRSVRYEGVNSRVILKNVVIYGDRGAGIAFLGDSIKAYIEDCVVQNTGHRAVVGGNGRFVGLRNSYMDTLIIKNSTLTNASDRVVRNMGTEVNYLEIDHFTALNNPGLHGSVQLGYVHTAKITNSIFANTISLGHEGDRVNEQTQPEKHFAVITLDTVFAGQVLEIRNNNIYTDQAILDVWAKYDTVEAPWVLTPTIETALGNALSEAYIQEPLTFTASCGTLEAFVDTYYATPNATEFPENWCVGGTGETGLFPDQVDLSYSTDAASFTAGDDNYPLGNLNYYPALKAKWEAGDVIGVEDRQMAVGKNSLRNYPNPFNHTTTIAYDLKSSATVSLQLFDATGRMVRGLVNEYQHAGTHEVIVNASDLPTGLYFYKLDTGSSVDVGNMLYVK
jgi:hypothetical protein